MTIQEYAKELVTYTWDSSQWEYFNELIIRESNWNPTAQNPNSSAYGIMQFLNSTWETVNCEKTNKPEKQLVCGVEYIKQRYGTPEKAIEFHNINNYY